MKPFFTAVLAALFSISVAFASPAQAPVEHEAVGSDFGSGVGKPISHRMKATFGIDQSPLDGCQTLLNSTITANGRGLITGPVLNGVITACSLGIFPAMGSFSPITGSWTPRQAADTALGAVTQDDINVKRIAAIIGTGQVCVGNALADTAAMNAAITKAAANPGSTIRLPSCAQPYIFNVAAGAIGFAVPSGTTVRGDGPRTIITWTDTATAGATLFGSSGTSAARVSDISFRDMTVRGSACTSPSFIPNYPFLPSYVDGLSFRGVISECSRAMGIASRSSTNVSADNNIVRFTMSDGINFAEDAAVSVRNNDISHTNDDAIGVHSDIYDQWGVRALVEITGNRLFDTQGIRVLSARVANISNNTGFILKQFAIDVSTIAPSGTGGPQEGMAAGIAVGIHNNVMANIVDRTNVDNFNQGSTGLLLSGASARAGSLAAIPGEASLTSPASVVDPYPEFLANSQSTAVATAGTIGIDSSGNQFIRTLPASNTARFPHWSSFGFGQIWGKNGFVDPSLAESDLSPNCIFFNGGVIRDFASSHDTCRGTATPIVLGQGVRYDATITALNATDFLYYGLLANSTGLTNVTVRNSVFDGDPYFKSASRTTPLDGTWKSASSPMWAYIQTSKGGLRFIGNTLRNLGNDIPQVDPSNPPATYYFAENIAEANATSFGGSFTAGANAGLGIVRTSSPRLRYLQVGSNPSQTSYGQVLAMPSYP